MRYHAHPHGYLTIDNDPDSTVATAVAIGFEENCAILAELASAGNHAGEWAARASELVRSPRWQIYGLDLLREMAEYHREQVKQ